MLSFNHRSIFNKCSATLKGSDKTCLAYHCFFWDFSNINRLRDVWASFKHRLFIINFIFGICLTYGYIVCLYHSLHWGGGESASVQQHIKVNTLGLVTGHHPLGRLWLDLKFLTSNFKLL